MKHLSDYVDEVVDTSPIPSLKKGVLVDIRLTREIEKWYGYKLNQNIIRNGKRTAWSPLRSVIV